MGSFDIEIKKIKTYLNVMDKNSKAVATSIGFLNINELYKEKYSSIYECCLKEFDLSRYKVRQALKFCYKFCDCRKASKFLHYYVKLEFCEIDYSKLCLCFDLTDEEFELLQISNELSFREIKKRIKQHFHVSIPERVSDQELENENDSYRVSDAVYKLDKYDCYFDNQDNCFVNGFVSSKTVRQGLKRLEENILKDNDNVYVVLRISKKEFGKYDK